MADAIFVVTAAVLLGGTIAWVVLAIVPGWERSRVARALVKGGTVLWIVALAVVALVIVSLFAAFDQLGGR